MIKATFSTGSIFTSLTLLGILFKIMHWPFAAMLLVLGVGGLALIFVPLYAKYQYNKVKQ